MFQVYNKRSGDRCGFVYNDGSSLATHVLVFMVVGLTKKSEVKYLLGYFGIKTITAADLYPLF